MSFLLVLDDKSLMGEKKGCLLSIILSISHPFLCKFTEDWVLLTEELSDLEDLSDESLVD